MRQNESESTKGISVRLILLVVISSLSSFFLGMNVATNGSRETHKTLRKPSSNSSWLPWVDNDSDNSSVLVRPAEQTLDGKTGDLLQEQKPKHIPTKLTFLHIPKTGTSFKLQMVQYLCNTSSYEQTVELVNKMWKPTDEHHPFYRCGEEIGRGHVPLHTPPEDTITMVRHPLKRIASGFVHNLHDCKRLGDEYKNSGLLCQRIREGIEQGDVSEISSVIYDYARCISGCGTNMLAGRECADRPPQPFGDEMEKLLETFAFIGHTDEWEQSLCSFHHQFPRLNGEPYISGPYHLHTSQNNKCEDDVLSILTQAPESELRFESTFPDPDWELYQKGVDLFRSRLPPHCK